MTEWSRPRILVLLKGRVDTPLSFRRQHRDEPCMLSEQAHIECNWDRIQRYLLDPLRKIGRVHVVVHTDTDPIELDPPVDEWITSDAASQWDRVTSVLLGIGQAYDAYVITRPDLVWKMDVPIAFPSSNVVEVAFYESHGCINKFHCKKCVINDVIFAFRVDALQSMMRIFRAMGQRTAQEKFSCLASKYKLIVAPLVEGIFTAATNKKGDKPNPLYRLPGHNGIDLGRERRMQIPFKRLSRQPKGHEKEIWNESLTLLLDEREAEGVSVVTVRDLEAVGVRNAVGKLYVRHPVNRRAYLVKLDDDDVQPAGSPTSLSVETSLSVDRAYLVELDTAQPAGSPTSLSMAAVVGIVIGCVVGLTVTITAVIYVSKFRQSMLSTSYKSDTGSIGIAVV